MSLQEARIAALAAAVHDAGGIVAHDAVGAAIIASESVILADKGITRRADDDNEISNAPLSWATSQPSSGPSSVAGAR